MGRFTVAGKATVPVGGVSNTSWGHEHRSSLRPTAVRLSVSRVGSCLRGTAVSESGPRLTTRLFTSP